MDTLQIQQQDGIQTITLKRGRANPINAQMVAELRQTVQALSQAPDIRGAILIGQPRYFSAGLDVIELYDYDPATMRAFWQEFSALMVDLMTCPKPLIAAISGHSPAGGCVLALCCDLRLMAKGDFRIGLNELPVGIVVPPTIFSLYASAIGEGKAYYHLLRGSLMLPEEALAEGLVHQVLPLEDLYTEARQHLLQYFKINATAWGISKQLLRAPLLRQLSGNFDELFEPVLKHWWSPEFRAQLEAMVQKLKSKSSQSS